MKTDVEARSLIVVMIAFVGFVESLFLSEYIVKDCWSIECGLARIFLIAFLTMCYLFLGALLTENWQKALWLLISMVIGGIVAVLLFHNPALPFVGTVIGFGIWFCVFRPKL